MPPCAPTAPIELDYVARAIQKVATHFGDRLGIIGFCGAPYTLASYMIEGGGSRNYIQTKQLMYRDTSCVAQPIGQDRGCAHRVLPCCR